PPVDAPLLPPPERVPPFDVLPPDGVPPPPERVPPFDAPPPAGVPPLPEPAVPPAPRCAASPCRAARCASAGSGAAVGWRHDLALSVERDDAVPRRRDRRGRSRDR